MSHNPTESESLDETLESAHRTLRRLEVDTYRLRTDLTRLEVALVDGQAGPAVKSPPVSAPPLEDEESSGRDAFGDSQPVEQTWSRELAAEFSPDFLPVPPADLAGADDAPASEVIEVVGEPTDPKPSQHRWAIRRTSRPVMASLSVHGALLLLVVSIGVAKVVHDEQPFRTYVDLGKTPPPIEEMKALDLGPIAQLDETNLKDAAPVNEAVDAGGSTLANAAPVDFETLAGVASVGDLGAVTALKPVDTGEGTLQPAGNGGTGADGMAPAGDGGNGTGRGAGGSGGRKGGQAGAAMFFGTKAKGDRFVFVVDNSSSMKNGRLEMALAELVKTVESLTPKQSFYVVFVSDRTYPMFIEIPPKHRSLGDETKIQRASRAILQRPFASGPNVAA